MKFKHLIMTRFNLPDRNQKKKVTDEWVRNRVESYERLSLASFEGQINQNFEVVVLFSDRLTPPDVIERVMTWGHRYRGIHPVILTNDDSPNGNTFPLQKMKDCPKNAVLPYLNGDEEYLITTMCDSDDAFNKGFIWRIQQEVQPKRELLYFSIGALLDMKTDTVYMQLDDNRHHMFPTLVEPVDDIKTVLYTKHPWMYLHAPPRKLEVNYPYFLRGIDGSNVMTRVQAKHKNRNVEPPFPLAELKDFTIPKTVDWQ